MLLVNSQLLIQGIVYNIFLKYIHFTVNYKMGFVLESIPSLIDYTNKIISLTSCVTWDFFFLDLSFLFLLDLILKAERSKVGTKYESSTFYMADFVRTY